MKNEFGERVKELRLEKGLTIKKLAEELNFSRPTISNWELGNKYPSLDALILVAKYFHVSTDYLLGLED